MSVDDAGRLVADAVTAGVFPAATVEVGDSATVLWSGAFGASTVHTPFDLASLTKVVATTPVIMERVRSGTLHLEAPVSEFFGEWRGSDRERVTVRDLLEHASGLPARLVDAPPATRREFEHDICSTPLEYVPRTQSIYSDLGFILLGFIAADRGEAPLARLFDRIRTRIGNTDPLTFDLTIGQRGLAAPTRPLEEDPRRGRILAGGVHDSYAFALGGVAGHAGLFGTAPSVGAFARIMLQAARQRERRLPDPFSPELVRAFITRSTVPGSSRALGWDTMLPTSSCGTKMTPQAFGHVGYTGTSLWIDPVRDRYFVLLTNRVFGDGTLDQMRDARRAFHDALGDV
jgi:CubicO group peptidase (beta-lactamase class C family)